MKLHQLEALNYLKDEGIIDPRDYYAITLDSTRNINFQGHYKSELVQRLSRALPLCKFTTSESSGYVETEVDVEIPTVDLPVLKENEGDEPKKLKMLVRITLT